ncbi:hypothetical protein [Rhodoplanes sp. Z2-YC6860]|uniref:hypothetical protein n=1 Tax=Rhodoplanes sp. Z2-YC6860 TaxID=674703 RepID=UPI000834549D|nr:hypothetical protein [Rhodoplanes sp. Z2-YC6860]
MSDRTWIKLDALRQPGMRRVLEAMKLVEQEAPKLVREAVLASDPGRNTQADVGGQPCPS